MLTLTFPLGMSGASLLQCLQYGHWSCPNLGACGPFPRWPGLLTGGIFSLNVAWSQTNGYCQSSSLLFISLSFFFLSVLLLNTLKAISINLEVPFPVLLPVFGVSSCVWSTLRNEIGAQHYFPSFPLHSPGSMVLKVRQIVS